jgi:hypothetical protein
MSEKDNTKPKPEMPAQARRRTFTAAFKLKLLREVEARQAAGRLDSAAGEELIQYHVVPK